MDAQRQCDATHATAGASVVNIVREPIDVAALQRFVASADCGAIVVFLGCTRRRTDAHETVTLHYECYEEMARAQMEQLLDAARLRWPIGGAALVHRVGEVPLGEASVAVAVSTPHRAAAFEAASWLIDELKRSVSIWKQDHAADGTITWIHPEIECGASEEPPRC